MFRSHTRVGGKQAAHLQFALALASVLAASTALHAAADPITRETGAAATIFRHVAGNDTLPNGALPDALAEDREGFLWVGTQNGLARWDGYVFRIYRADPDRIGALPDNFIAALHQARDGTLWVGTENGSLARYDPATDRFTATMLPGSANRGEVADIADAAAGAIWVATGDGLFEVDPRGRVVTNLRAAALPDRELYAVLEDKASGLWIGGRHGLFRRAPGATRFTPVPFGGGMAGDVVVRCLKQDTHGRVWAGTGSRGAYVIDTATDGTPGSVRPVAETQAGADTINSMNEISPREMWLGTAGGGIVAVDGGTLDSIRLRHDPLAPTSVSDGAVLALHRDRGGLVWIATLHGLDNYDSEQHAIRTIFGDRNQPGALGITDVISVLVLPDGRIWAGSRRGTIDILAPDGRKIAGIRADPARPDSSLSTAPIYSMLAGDDGYIYIGTAKGLYRSDIDGRTVTRVPLAGRAPDAHVWHLCRHGDRLWFGGPDGAWELALRSGEAPQILRHFAAGDLTDPRVITLDAAPDGTVWFGTRNGLNRLAPGATKVERILPDRSWPASLSSGHMASLVTDEQGRLWAGTSDRGINVWDGRDASQRPQFRHIGALDGLPDDGVDSLLANRDGAIWAATDGGLAVIDPDSLTLRALKAPEGVVIPSYWVGAASVGPDGTLAFGGTEGMTLVQPALLKQVTYRPKLAVTDVQIGGAPVWAGHATAGGALAPLIVPPGSHGFAVTYASLDYAAPLQNRYAYQLDGFDPGWVAADATRRTATYTNLPPGHYMLRLRGSNRAGLWNDPGLALPIQIVPAWYQTIWWHGAEFCAAAGAVVLLLHARTRLLRQRQAELEHQVAARTAELVASQQKLREAAYCDLLTGLANRRAFHEHFQALADRGADPPGQFALLLIDLDGFKQINDTLGHDAGDEILVAAAGRLRNAVREGDFVARLGGDEFAVLLLGAPDTEVIARVCNRLIQSLSAPVGMKGMAVRVGASVGVALFPAHGATQELLYKSADLALYECKGAGRGVWRLFNVSGSAAVTESVG